MLSNMINFSHENESFNYMLSDETFLHFFTQTKNHFAYIKDLKVQMKIFVIADGRHVVVCVKRLSSSEKSLLLVGGIGV